MKEYTVKLTEKEIGLLIHVANGYSAHAVMQAAEGKRDKEKAWNLYHEVAVITSKLDNKYRQIHSTT